MRALLCGLECAHSTSFQAANSRPPSSGSQQQQQRLMTNSASPGKAQEIIESKTTAAGQSYYPVAGAEQPAPR
jgi:hypothetical protein